MIRSAIGLAVLSWAGAASAQTHEHHHAPAPASPPAAAQAPAGAAYDASVLQSAAPAADSVWGAAAMDRARAVLRGEHGGATAYKVMSDLLERDDDGGWRWSGEAWRGGDIHRFALKTEGETSRADGVEHGEVQALYSRAVGRYTAVQTGLRRDFGRRGGRTYAVLGIDALAPYWFELEGMVFVSDGGKLSARGEATYDLRLTQRAVLQPRVELNLADRGEAAEDGSLEAGLRLRYEIKREFAPYVGVSWERVWGEAGGRLRGDGGEAEGLRAVAGLRAWF
jgi:copper resistance protein B